MKLMCSWNDRNRCFCHHLIWNIIFHAGEQKALSCRGYRYKGSYILESIKYKKSLNFFPNTFCFAHLMLCIPGCSLEELMLKLKLQYFGHLMQTVDSSEKTLMLGGIVGRRRYDRGWDGWMASSTRWTWVWVNSRSWWWTGRPGVLWFMGLQRVRHDWATELIPILVWVINLTA